jgi:hypothetical protein
MWVKKVSLLYFKIISKVEITHPFNNRVRLLFNKGSQLTAGRSVNLFS